MSFSTTGMRKYFSYILICLVFVGFLAPVVFADHNPVYVPKPDPAKSVMDAAHSALKTDAEKYAYDMARSSGVDFADAIKIATGATNTNSVVNAINEIKGLNSISVNMGDGMSQQIPGHEITREQIEARTAADKATYEAQKARDNQTLQDNAAKLKATADAIDAAKKEGEKVSCGGFFEKMSVECLWKDFLALIGTLLITIASWFLYAGGAILNFVLNYTIINFSANISPMIGINIAWKVVRDLMNIAFIFLLVYEAIKLIIGQNDTIKVKKFIGMIVLASLLINFSLFFTKIMIDASNIVTVGFYNSIIGPDAAKDPTTGLSNPIMSALGLTKAFSPSQLKVIAGGDTANIVILALFISVLFVITAFIFFAVAIMFLIRYIVLIILLMLSPIGFMGWAIPQLKPYTDKWWDSLQGQLLWAPIYMIMTWVTLTLIGSGGFVKKSDAVITGMVPPPGQVPSADSIGLIINFGVIIGLLIASIVIAKSTATKGQEQIGTATKWATAAAGGVIMGGAGALGRRTVGAAASRLGESQRFQNFAGRSAFGQKLLQGTRKVGDASFDTRSSYIGGKVASTTGVDFGTAQQGGFNKTLAEKTAAKEKFAQSLQGDQAKRAYAVRQASGIGILGGLGIRGGSRSNARTVFGTMGRSNRVLASKTLNSQIQPLQTLLQTQRDNFVNQQNNNTNLNQQLGNLQSELTSLQAIRTPNNQQRARIAQLTSANSPINNINAQILANNTRITDINGQIAYLDNEVRTREGEIDRLGITNPNNPVPLTHQQLAQNAGAVAAGQPIPTRNVPRSTRADEQNF